MQQPCAALLDDGSRLHLQHGPIDLIIGAEGETPQARQTGFEAARDRFRTLLDGLVTELGAHRSQLSRTTRKPCDPVAQRMYAGALPFCGSYFVTPMIAVAGSVADEVLKVMTDAAPLRRAYVNNGGDIAVHLQEDAQFSIAMAQTNGADLGRIRFGASEGIGGLATSGAKGRSHSFGIADSVTVLARSAAQADAAATLIANAVDLPKHPQIQRMPANTLAPDSDLGTRSVVTFVPRLDPQEAQTALARGQAVAQGFLAEHHIIGCALFLQGQAISLGGGFDQSLDNRERLHA